MPNFIQVVLIPCWLDIKMQDLEYRRPTVSTYISLIRYICKITWLCHIWCCFCHTVIHVFWLNVNALHFLYTSIGWFHIIAIVNCTAINMGTHKNLLKSDFISFRELFLGVGCLSHMVDLFSCIRGVSLLSSNCRILSMFSKGEFLQSPYIYLAGAVVEWIKRLLESSIAFGCWFMHQLLRFESRPLLLV